MSDGDDQFDEECPECGGNPFVAFTDEGGTETLQCGNNHQWEAEA